MTIYCNKCNKDITNVKTYMFNDTYYCSDLCRGVLCYTCGAIIENGSPKTFMNTCICHDCHACFSPTSLFTKISKIRYPTT